MRGNWRNGSGAVLPLLVGAAIVACGDDAGIGPGAVITVEAPAARIVEGESIRLGVKVGGQPVSAGAVKWRSTDPSTLTVDAAGVARGVGAGVAYAVATGGQARDSVQLTVRFRSVSPNTLVVRVAGQASTVLQFGGRTMMVEGLVSGRRTTFINANTADPDGPGAWVKDDSVLRIFSSTGLEVGQTLIRPPMLQRDPWRLSTPQGSGAFLAYREGSSRFRQYIQVSDAQLQISSVTLPPRPGADPGLVTGSIAFEAAGLTVEFGPNGSEIYTPLADTTVTVYAEFSTPLYHLLASSARATLTGPARHSGEHILGGNVDLKEGGLTFDLRALLNAGTVGSEVDFALRTWVPTPAPGTYALGETLPAQLDDTAGGATPWSYAVMAPLIRSRPEVPAGHLGPAEYALGRGGTITIESYTAPTARYFGRVSGTMTLDLGYWATRFTGESLTVAFPFTLPVRPLEEIRIPY